MDTRWYTFVLEPGRLLAVESDARSAAAALTAGRRVILAGPADLARIAARDGRDLVVRPGPLSHIRKYFPPLRHAPRGQAAPLTLELTI